MNSDSPDLDFLFTEFGIWLENSRPALNQVFRHYSAINYFLSTVSLGLIIFTVHNIYENPDTWIVNIAIFLLFVIIFILSRKLSYTISGLRQYSSINIVLLERKNFWLAEVDKHLENIQPILNDPYVRIAMSQSAKRKFYAYTFLQAAIVISDYLSLSKGKNRAESN